jgi:hypothetical protein
MTLIGESWTKILETRMRKRSRWRKNCSTLDRKRECNITLKLAMKKLKPAKCTYSVRQQTTCKMYFVKLKKKKNPSRNAGTTLKKKGRNIFSKEKLTTSLGENKS